MGLPRGSRAAVWSRSLVNDQVKDPFHALPVPCAHGQSMFCLSESSLLEMILSVVESESILRAGMNNNDKGTHLRWHGRGLIASEAEGVALYV